MGGKDTGKKILEKVYRASGIERGGLYNIPHLKEKGSLHGMLTCGWDTDTQRKKMWKNSPCM